MCERKAAGHVPAAGVAAVAGAAVLGAVWAVLPGILLAAGITVGVACAGGIGVFVVLERSHRPAVRAPQRAALPAPSRLPVAGGVRPAAISGRRQDAASTVIRIGDGGKVER